MALRRKVTPSFFSLPTDPIETAQRLHFPVRNPVERSVCVEKQLKLVQILNILSQKEKWNGSKKSIVIKYSPLETRRQASLKVTRGGPEWEKGKCWNVKRKPDEISDRSVKNPAKSGDELLIPPAPRLHLDKRWRGVKGSKRERERERERLRWLKGGPDKK